MQAGSQPTCPLPATVLIILHLFCLLIGVAINIGGGKSLVGQSLRNVPFARQYLRGLMMDLAYDFHLAGADEDDGVHRLELVKVDAKPNDPDAIIWYGRRLAYLGRFREAIDTFTSGAKKFPDDARFYRHRGHRRITVRQFDLAIADFHKAEQLMRNRMDDIEPDGQPNSRNIPTST